MAFVLDPLPYASDSLEPNIDKQTMEIHHGKHHNAYVTNLNNAIAGTEMENKSIEDLLASISQSPVAVRNNGGGHYNHTMFWNTISGSGGGQPTGELADAITAKFGSFDAFKEEFTKAATTRFGSGWAWLVATPDGGVAVTSTPNQDNPLMDTAEVKGFPIIGLDVWEHAYYLKYQNRRPDYIAAYFNVVDWSAAEQRYQKSKANA
ncbi:superoxide dismutase [Spirosoma utsteinense]|uniref:Superoxide dismutase n=1 Tax=Spirosoma utsteinense TaxID=2585773 RepID=A0ABR6W4N5_9BACT|nr:superoxide dismutase [Spirosoma utsteinense]MBC3785408.1 Fe-Mn family superoxide dismutase [Spirosoma utsteinense]MBC3791564.1 Fe-Mn family superoxide dismutase [Spirosoma utsteinense]